MAVEAERMAIGQACAADLPAVRTVLARALADDPLMRWIFGERADRPAAVAAFLAPPIEEYVLAGTAWLAAEDRTAVAAAAWRLPRTGDDGVGAGTLLPGAGTLALLVGDDRAARVWEGFAAMGDLFADEPHALLHLLGVDTERRGAGLGSALVRAGLAELPDGLPAHVTTTLERNVALYVSLGFEHVGGVRLGDGPVMHGLRREPAVLEEPPGTPIDPDDCAAKAG